jgi:hypothetical protein
MVTVRKRAKVAALAMGLMLVAAELGVVGAPNARWPIGPGVASAEAFHTSVATATTPLRTCTDMRQGSCKGWTSIAKGNKVTMICWRKQQPVRTETNDNFGTDMFFWVKAKTGANEGGVTVQGYVSANHIGNQWRSSPYCDNMPRFRAARWAGEKYGERSYDGECQTFVHDAYLKGVGTEIGSPVGNAFGFWNRYLSDGSVNLPANANYVGVKRAKRFDSSDASTWDAPVGALVYWRPVSANGDGHVAMSIGAGWVISTGTDSIYGNGEKIRIFRIHNYATDRYLGWIEFNRYDR